MATAPQFERVDSSYLFEEETLSDYKAKRYYPVKLGEVFQNRYKTIGKLGYGSASTVWLCRDIQKLDKYIALKVYVNDSKYHRELPVYEEINALQSTLEGRDHVRKMHDSFELQGPDGTHTCLVHEPLGISLGELKDMNRDGVFSVELVRQTMRYILSALHFLHKEARIIHTDLQPSNMLLGIDDDSVLSKFEQYEAEAPCPRKLLEDRTIYMSRPMPLTKGAPSITDLSEARYGDQKHTDRIMPNVYRAPEVILGRAWSYPVDIWGFAMVLWDLFQPKRLFSGISDSEGRYSEARHLAKMVAIMGTPPLDFLQGCGERVEQYWNRDGTWKGLAPIPDVSLESLDLRLEGEEKQQFVAFMRKMLQWNPDERQDSEGVFWDEWLLADLIESGEVVRED